MTSDMKTMPDPKLIAAKVVIHHRADDGYRSEVCYGSLRDLDDRLAKDALLAAHSETARLLALYGFADEAKAEANDAFAAVAAFFATRKETGE